MSCHMETVAVHLLSSHVLYMAAHMLPYLTGDMCLLARLNVCPPKYVVNKLMRLLTDFLGVIYGIMFWMM